MLIDKRLGIFDSSTGIPNKAYSNYLFYAFPWPRNYVVSFISPQTEVYNHDAFKTQLEAEDKSWRKILLIMTSLLKQLILLYILSGK